MYNRDYIITYDESGKLYIAHAWGKGTAHKYIKKIGEGAKARYFYTQEQLKAFYDKSKNKVSDAAEKAKTTISDKVGLTARREYSAAYDKWREAYHRLGQAKKANEKANNRYDTRMKMAQASTEAGLAAIARDSAVQKYRDTPLGKIEDALRSMANKFDEAKSEVKSAAEAIKNNPTNIQEAIAYRHELEKYGAKTLAELGYTKELEYLANQQVRHDAADKKVSEMYEKLASSTGKIGYKQAKETFDECELYVYIMKSAHRQYMNGTITKDEYNKILDENEAKLDYAEWIFDHLID